MTYTDLKKLIENKSILVICTVVFLICLIIFILVRRNQVPMGVRNPVRPADFPSVLVPPVDAELVNYSVSKRTPHVFNLSYFIKDPYPAKYTLDFIKEELRSHGWWKLKLVIIGQIEPGWFTSLSENDRLSIKSYSEDWVNEKGENIHVTLEYSFLDGKERDPNSLCVNLGYLGTDTWIHPLVLQYKAKYPEEFKRDANATDSK